jgi:NAD-dependent SIR2 family protein deacetylase
MRIPTELIPKCPDCGKPLALNLRSDDKFVEDVGWHIAAKRYEDYIRRHKEGHILYLELGVGMNTPSIIKYPFWQMTYQNPDAMFACINLGDAFAPAEIKKRSVCIDADIRQTLQRVGTARTFHLMDGLGSPIPKN